MEYKEVLHYAVVQVGGVVVVRNKVIGVLVLEVEVEQQQEPELVLKVKCESRSQELNQVAPHH